jgi:hypothetical protein
MLVDADCDHRKMEVRAALTKSHAALAKVVAHQSI